AACRCRRALRSRQTGGPRASWRSVAPFRARWQGADAILRSSPRKRGPSLEEIGVFCPRVPLSRERTERWHASLIRAAHRDDGETRIGQEILADRALALEQLEPRAALLALADWDRIEHRIDTDELLDVLLELVDALDREADVVHAGRQ